MALLPKMAGFHTVELSQYLQELFQLDKEIADASPLILPLETPEELLEYLTKEHNTTTFIFNNLDNQLVGYLSYEKATDISNLYEVINLGVHPKHQHQGYGTKLMEHFFALTEGNPSRLVTNPKNTQAFIFYQKLGYEPVKQVENYFGDGTPRTIFYRPSS